LDSPGDGQRNVTAMSRGADGRDDVQHVTL
jgi:hypothetical protein